MNNFNVSSDTFYLTPEVKKRKEKKNRNIILCVLLVFSIAITLGIFTGWYLRRHNDNIYVKEIKSYFQPTCSGIADEKKFDCYPDAPVTESQCLSRGCCFSVPKNITLGILPPLNIPYCYYPSNYDGYVVTDVTESSRRIQAKLKRVKPSGFPSDVANLNLRISFIDDSTIRIKITDAKFQRYEVPLQLHYQTKGPTNPLYFVNIDAKYGLLKVTRKSSGTVIFNADLSKLVYSDQFLQISSDLPSSYIYGIGEHYGGLLRSVNWTRFTLINSDLAPIPNHGLYGSHPFYTVLEKGGIANGVFLLNSNIMDIILQPAPAITFRPIGGILDFFIMLGPSPKEVAQQYSNVIGKTFMPPFWSLGFQLCRYGYNSLNKTRETMQRNIDAGIPLDVQWNDIDYMDNYKDFTYDKVKFAGLPKFVDDLHTKGMHYVLMTDPGISSSEKEYYAPYEEGVDDDIFVKNANGTIFSGKVWTSGTTAYPDFSHPAAVSFWTRQFKRLYEEVKFDGVWIDMNEPSNFYDGGIDGCPNLPPEKPQYVPGGIPLITKTVCMSAKHYYTIHYNEHNIYGYREAIATYEALLSVRRKRPFIISRATFAGQGVYSGHWSGDIFSTWEDMRYTIPSMINFNIYGIPMVGSDICGFNGNTTVELCARWQSLGAFYPFSRNHNERVTIEQDPVALGPTVVDATRNALIKRYTMLPYLYTLFYRSHAFGETVVRPLFFEFTEDVNTYSIDEQFLWGSSMMIVPVLYPNITTVDAYFPKGLWYDGHGSLINSTGEKLSIDIPISDIYLSFRAGNIIPALVPDITTTALRRNSHVILVVLDEQLKASGELYWDDGDSLDTYENGFYNLIQFEASNNHLNTKIVKNSYQTDMHLGFVFLFGLEKVPTEVTVNDHKCSQKVALNSTLNSKENVDSSLFGMNAVLNETLPSNATCYFYKQDNMFAIMNTEPTVSLLSPLSITWK